MKNLPKMLDASAAGDQQTAEELLPHVYQDLRKIASAMMAHEPAGHTLQTTALVHDAWLRLADGAKPATLWISRAHFIAAATEAMRRILIERARRKRRIKHGGGQERVDADAVEIAIAAPDDHLVAMDTALQELAQLDPRQAALVKLRYFGGMEVKEAAHMLGISAATAQRDWKAAREWLRRQIAGR